MTFALFSPCLATAPRRAAILLACAVLAACSSATPEAPSERTPLQLNQGWSASEIEFYEHATEGTNLAPLDFVMNLPDPAEPQARFIDRLSRVYGFIPSPVSALNPQGLPVGFAIDKRSAELGDRVYLGINCAACHTRQLTYSKPSPGGRVSSWTMAVHGGPGLIDYPRFKQDLFDALLALKTNDDLVQRFGQRMLGRAPSADEVAAWRAEITEFTGPVVMGRSLVKMWQIPPADFGPGNLNALTQGNYNNVGLGAWLKSKGYPQANVVPLQPRFEGATNYPPMWFSPTDTWAQWFAEIHHPGPRNWIQSVSTSEVRPPKLTERLQEKVVLGSIHFENIADIQRSLELLRTPKWPSEVFGPLDARLVAQGEALYQQHCANCHTREILPPNELGFVFKNRPAFDVGTDAVASQQFAAGGQRRVDDLKALSDKIIFVRRGQLAARYGDAVADNTMKLYSRGRPNQFALASDDYAQNPGATWPRSGAAYWASPMQGIFATSPFLHNGSVPTLRDLLNPPEQRPVSFRTGSSEFDPVAVGLKNEGSFVFDTREPGKGNGGHLFGTALAPAEKAALIEYLKSL